MTHGEAICEIDAMKTLIKEAELQFRNGDLTQEQYADITYDACIAIEDYSRLINCAVDVNTNYDTKKV